MHVHELRESNGSSMKVTMAISTTVGWLRSGEKFYEHHIGDFVEVHSSFTTSISFSIEDAQWVARLLLRFADVSLVAVAVYPWVEAAWEALTAHGWASMSTKTFVRHRWLRSAGSQRWDVGRADSEQKLAEIIHWAWTLPGRDTLLFIPISDKSAAAIGPLVTEFQDDQEENGENELRLLRYYSVVASRGFEGRYLRIFSTTVDEAALQRCMTGSR
jgi:hypothetical protein